MKRRDPSTRLGGLDFIEEAIHALRLASPATLLCYYVGAVPFVLAILFFWSDMSRSAQAEQHLVPGAIALTFLFIWMKLWQSTFALRLHAQVSNHPAPKFTGGLIWRATATQCLLHATGLVLIPIALQILVPTLWVFGFYQNATVLGFREPALGPLMRRSWKQACWAAGSGHTALLALGLFGLLVFINIAIAILGAPHLLKILLGIETNSTLSIESTLNTTFLAAALGIAYLCVDPIIKAVYVLRCFYGEARTTGEDLRVTLRTFKAPAIAVVIAMLTLSTPSTVRGAAPPPPTTESGTQLDRSINDVLQRREYAWREPRQKVEKEKDDSSLVERVQKWMKAKARAFGDWLDSLFRNNRTRTLPTSKWSFSTHGFVYILIAVLAAFIIWLAWLLWRARSRHAAMEINATAAIPAPDLTREDVGADELPVDGWHALALEMLSRGELRLAMRAFYLSSLAHLAGRNLVSLAKFKSNRDYEREVARRGHALPALANNFSANVSIFDRVWYGEHPIDQELLHQFRSNVEAITSQ